MPLGVGAAVLRRRVGHVGNPSDFQPQGSSGSVDSEYAFSRFELTNSEDAVNFVTFFEALRVANWIHDGEGSGDTETGAYTLLRGTATPTKGSTAERNPGALFAVRSQDE